jgi:hypothetical protein
VKKMARNLDFFAIFLTFEALTRVLTCGDAPG